MAGEAGVHLERGHHLALFLAVQHVVVVLHRDEGREVVRDRMVCRNVGRDTSRGVRSGEFTLHLVDYEHISERSRGCGGGTHTGRRSTRTCRCSGPSRPGRRRGAPASGQREHRTTASTLRAPSPRSACLGQIGGLYEAEPADSMEERGPTLKEVDVVELEAL